MGIVSLLCWEQSGMIFTGPHLTSILQVSSGLLPDGRHFVSRARDEAANWRQLYKAPIPAASLADRMGSYVQAYTLYSSVRPFGVTAIIGGWDSEAELPVDGQVGSGPQVGSGGKQDGAKHGGPSLYMIEPSGLYWVFAPLNVRQGHD
jgi:20S proteasome subunit alpha 7